MSEHLSDLVLDALRIGAPPVSGEDRAHLLSCAACRARQQALDEDAANFQQRFDLPGLAADALMRASQPSPWRSFSWLRFPWLRFRWLRFAFVPAAVAAAVLLVVVLRPPQIRTKGAASAHVEVFVIDGDARRAIDGPVARDARLAVRVVAAGPEHVRILWGSEPDRFDALYPEERAMAWAIEGPSWLEREVVLDGAREPELLGVVACEDEVSHAEALTALAAGAREGCVVETVEVKKR